MSIATISAGGGGGGLLLMQIESEILWDSAKLEQSEKPLHAWDYLIGSKWKVRRPHQTGITQESGRSVDTAWAALHRLPNHNTSHSYRPRLTHALIAWLQ